MGYKLHKDIRAKSISYGKTRAKSAIKYIVIHYTGNKTDKAVNNAKFYKNKNTRSAGAHYFVDATDVYESIDPLRIAWAVGGSKYSDCDTTGGGKYYKTVTNANSISIEMCSTEGEISDDTYENVVALTKELMAIYNVPASNVVRHFDVTGKRCPGWSGWIGTSDSIWTQFRKDIGYKTAKASKTRTGIVITKGNLNVRVGPGTEYGLANISPLKPNTTVTISKDATSKKKELWYKISCKGGSGYVLAKYIKES